MSNYTVYMHISPSGKRYIGITSQEPKKRWNNGKGYKNQMFYRAIEKYGWDNIEHIIIAKDLNEETAKWLEIELIRELDTTNPSKGYNTTLGGEGANGTVHSEEWKQTMSKKFSGEGNPMYGKIFSQEYRQKLSESHLGKNNGENHPRARKVICITTNEIFDTLTEGAKKYNINGTGYISNCCRGYVINKGKKYNVNYCGKHPITGEKLVWKYYDEYLKEQELLEVV